MSLQPIAEYNPQYFQESSIKNELISRPVFISSTKEEIGTLNDVLVDETGRFRYLVVKAGSWLNERQFLLPAGICRTNKDRNAIGVLSIDDKQILEQLPAYNSASEIDYEYEEALRKVYRQLMNTDKAEVSHDRDSYSYDREPELYQFSDEDSQTIKLYEERLITSKQRNEVGEVTVGKHIETETKEVEIPVEKERVVIKRTNVTNTTPVEPGAVDFEEGEVARVKVYEETANIEKQAFVREEVEIKKEVEKEVVTASETLRKEELDIDGQENVEIES